MRASLFSLLVSLVVGEEDASLLQTTSVRHNILTLIDGLQRNPSIEIKKYVSDAPAAEALIQRAVERSTSQTVVANFMALPIEEQERLIEFGRTSPEAHEVFAKLSPEARQAALLVVERHLDSAMLEKGTTNKAASCKGSSSTRKSGKFTCTPGASELKTSALEVASEEQWIPKVSWGGIPGLGAAAQQVTSAVEAAKSVSGLVEKLKVLVDQTKKVFIANGPMQKAGEAAIAQGQNILHIVSKITGNKPSLAPVFDGVFTTADVDVIVKAGFKLPFDIAEMILNSGTDLRQISCALTEITGLMKSLSDLTTSLDGDTSLITLPASIHTALQKTSTFDKSATNTVDNANVEVDKLAGATEKLHPVMESYNPNNPATLLYPSTLCTLKTHWNTVGKSWASVKDFYNNTKTGTKKLWEDISGALCAFRSSVEQIGCTGVGCPSLSIPIGNGVSC
jgi:hypothetical protein